MSRYVLSVLILPTLLVGCGWVSIGGSRNSDSGSQPPSSQVETVPSSSAPSAPVSQTVTVQPGDTIYTIARSRNVPVRALIAANNLQPPYALSPGRTLVLPSASQQTHTVRAGDTLYALSRQYGSDVTSIARANNLQPPYALAIGQQLTIPGGSVAAAEARPAPAPGLMPAARSIDPRPDSVAVESVPLAPPPRPSAPPPQPAAGPGSPPPMSPPPRLDATPPVTSAAPPPLPTVPPSAPVVAAAPATAPAAVKPEPSGGEPPPRSGRGFLRPVSGDVLTPFGPRPGGLHNDGINIAVAKGTPVRAAEAGTVAYAGNELPGYGNLVLIKHADGWVSAYGHNDELMVRRGQTVKRGDVIARAGATGNVSQPQVHFELRRGARAVDPTPYLASSSASR